VLMKSQPDPLSPHADSIYVGSAPFRISKPNDAKRRNPSLNSKSVPSAAATPAFTRRPLAPTALTSYLPCEHV
jgi:hypothetical protein